MKVSQLQIELSSEEIGMIIAVLAKQIYELRQKGDTQSVDKLIPIKDYLKRYHTEPSQLL
jgi:hypothetical protein